MSTPVRTRKSTQRRENVSITIADKSKKRPAKKVSRNTKQTRPQPHRNNLSECAKDYAAALVDPFDGPMACVPSSYPPIPSFKTRVWNRGFSTVGAAGIGFVTVRPSGIVSSDSTGISFSTSAYAGAGFPTTFVETGVTSAATNAPFANASFGETTLGTQYRLVSAGVRVWYQDTELNLSGEMLAVRQPDNQTLAGLSYAQVQGFPGTRRVRVGSDRAPLDCTWVPVKPSELEYNGTFTNLPSMGILFSSVNGVKFGYEVYAIVEYIGYSVPNKTPSHADPAGFAAVLTAAQTNGDSWYGDARDAAQNLLSKASSGLANLSNSNLGRHVVNYASNWALNRLGFPSLSLQTDPVVNTEGIEPNEPPPSGRRPQTHSQTPLPEADALAPKLPYRPSAEQAGRHGNAAAVWAAYDAQLTAYADYWERRVGGEEKVAETTELYHG